MKRASEKYPDGCRVVLLVYTNVLKICDDLNERLVIFALT